MERVLSHLHELRAFDRERMLQPQDRRQCRVLNSRWETIVSPAPKSSPRRFLAQAAPLLEEERYIRGFALLLDR